MSLRGHAALREGLCRTVVGTIDADPDMGAQPVVIGIIQPNTPAAEAGLQPDDHIIAVNGEAVRDATNTRELIDKYKGSPIQLSIERNGQPLMVTATVRKLENGTERLGFGFKRAELPMEPASIASAANYAFTTNVETVKATGSVLGQVFAGKRSVKDSGIGGPIGIFQQSAEATRYWVLRASSLILYLDQSKSWPLQPAARTNAGWRPDNVLGIEKVMSWFGRTLSMVARERIQLTGLAIVLLLMVTVIFFDVSRLIGN